MLRVYNERVQEIAEIGNLLKSDPKKLAIVRT